MVDKLLCEVSLIAKVNVCGGGMSVDRVCSDTDQPKPGTRTPGT